MDFRKKAAGAAASTSRTAFGAAARVTEGPRRRLGRTAAAANRHLVAGETAHWVLGEPAQFAKLIGAALTENRHGKPRRWRGGRGNRQQ